MIVGWGDGRKEIEALSQLSPSSLFVRPRARASGQGRAFVAKGTAELSGSVLGGVPLAGGAPGVARELSSSARVQKPVGWGGLGPLFGN